MINMVMVIYIYEHERMEALKIYGDWLTIEQQDKLRKGPHLWKLIRNGRGETTLVDMR